MPLADIKDSGALAGFVRWGWPYHGLCTNVTIAGSGKTIPQPLNGNTWLIDKGLPAVDISPAEVISEAAEGREWWNYSLISGSVIYGKYLPLASDSYGSYPAGYIHIDQDGIPWRVTLSFSFPATNTVRVTASIVRFGLFDADIGPMTPITKTADAACQGIEITSGYYSRQVRLHDVHTNGSKALACVEHFFEAAAGYPEISVMSAINVTFSGSGGSGGSGLTMAVNEAVARSVLTYGGNLPTIDAYNYGTGVFGMGIDASYTAFDPACPGGISQTNTGSLLMDSEVRWLQGGVMQQGSDFTLTRICYYDSAGEVVALKYRTVNTAISTLNITNGPTMIVSVQHNRCNVGNDPPLEMRVDLSLSTQQTLGHYILRNNVIIDQIEYKNTQVHTDEHIYYNSFGTSSKENTFTLDQSVNATWTGSLTGGFPTNIEPNARYIQRGFTSANPIFYAAGQFYVTPDVTVGIYRNGRCAAFYRDTGGTWSYGTVTTPAGPKTTALTVPFYYSHQRKTDDFSFSVDPICFV